MRIATYNINGVNGRLKNLLAWLADTQPDVVCLQELKAPDEKFPARTLEEAGYGACWQGQRAWNGVAILARGREPIVTARGLPGDAADEQARYIEAAVSGVIVGCLYAPNGNPLGSAKFDYKLGWFTRFLAHAETMLASGHPVVLAGDYNIIPQDRDVHAPDEWRDNALFQPVLSEIYAGLLARGWTDAVRTRFPQEAVYTFWKYWPGAFERDRGMRIDHFLLSPAVAPRLTAAGVDRAHRGREGASDHAPVWIELKPEKAQRRR